MSERLVSASARFGVVRPTSASIPVQPMNSVSKCSDRIVRSATGPTSASEVARMPPVTSTEVPSGPRLPVYRFATRSELVTMVSPGTSSRHWASANVVVPEAIATAVLGLTRAAAVRAIVFFSGRSRTSLSSKPAS